MLKTCHTSADNGLVNLGRPEKVWSIPAIHGELDRLTALHDNILAHFKPGDRLVYLGNYTGYGPQSAACIDEILTFRRMIMSISGVKASDLVYLRGMQEEMWQKLLQLQFAPNASDVLLWMLGNGMSPTLASYNICPHDGIEACRRGIMDLTKWTHSIRHKIRAHAGHEIFMNQLQRAAYSDEASENPLLFVHAGINAQKPLTDQGDALWWDGQSFDTIHAAYRPFHKVVRGYDPAHRGMMMNCVTATIDDACGFGGDLICAGFDQSGEAATILEN